MVESYQDEPQSEAVPAFSIGATLRQAREQRALSVGDAAMQLNIAARHLEALEQDAFESLPGVAFARGYLRSYARLLGLDADHLIVALNRAMQGEAEPVVASINKVRPQANLSHPLVRGVAVLLVLALLGFSLWWWQAQTEPAVLVQPEAPAAAAPRVEAAAPEAPAAEPEVEEPLDAEPAAASEEEPVYLSDEEAARLAAQLAADDQADAAAPVAEEPTPAAEAVTPAAALLLQFEDECWVTLKTPAGRMLVARTFNPGDQLSISVEAGSELLVGRVSAVSEAQFAGRALALSELARQNVARITLSAP